MAGHSKWANIKHRKGAQDKKRAGAFTRAGREIIIAAKMGGGDPEFNPRLRVAIAAAKAINMPKDRIENAIKKGSGELDEGEVFEEIRYEGYGTGGIAIIVDALTDNRNRSASDIRSIFTKHGGNMGETGNVAFMFDKVGLIQYKKETASEEQMFEAALEAGADDCESGGEIHEITCAPDDFGAVSEALTAKFGDPETGRLGWKPKNTIEIDFETAQQIITLIEALEENDDVQHVTANFEISDETAKKLAGG